ncbi:MAG: ABC transporter permease, partial [Deltaproteobacteria bacterium]|nr:ABC transporter permease [Deltaproteobacteria bacterium]
MGQRRYLLRRFIQNGVTLLVVITIIFALFRTLPGDPSAVLVDPLAPAEVRDELIKRLGLDRPLWQQYLVYMRDLVTGDLGRSFLYQRPVTEVLGEKIVNTLALVLTTFLVAYTLGAAGGVVLAWKRGQRTEVVGNALVLIFRSAPVFWSGIIAIMLFSFILDLLPLGGMRSIGEGGDSGLARFLDWDFVYHLVLPVTVGALHFCGLPLLLVRNTVLEIVGEDFMEMARAKGMPTRTLIFKHALRNALLPAVTASALFIGYAMGGMVLIEYVFSWPGLG